MSEPEFLDEDAPESRRGSDAFRAAFAHHAEDAAFAPLDPASLRLQAQIRDAAGRTSSPDASRSRPDDRQRRRPSPSVRRWPQVLLAAAAVVALIVVVPLGLASLLRGGASATSMAAAPAGAGAPATSSAAAAAETNAASGRAGGASAQDASAAPQASAPKPATTQGQSFSVPAGYRVVPMLDAVAFVPDAWGTGTAVGQDWCTAAKAQATQGSTPFVAEAPPPVISGCGPIPEALQSEHLEWRAATQADADGERTVNGWTYTSRLVGSAYLTYVHRPGTPSDVLRTAQKVG